MHISFIWLPIGELNLVILSLSQKKTLSQDFVQMMAWVKEQNLAHSHTVHPCARSSIDCSIVNFPHKDRVPEIKNLSGNLHFIFSGNKFTCLIFADFFNVSPFFWIFFIFHAKRTKCIGRSDCLQCSNCYFFTFSHFFPVSPTFSNFPFFGSCSFLFLSFMLRYGFE